MTFGPGSILWECYGERLGYLNAPRAGLLQLAYPDLGRGVEEHSAFYTEPWERLFRSVPQIVGTIYNGPGAQATADKIREYHRDIKGTHPDGTRYHALDPDTYFWAHATFIDAVLSAHDFFGKPFTLQQKRLLYLECVEWWQMYGLSMRPVPPTYDEFEVYWQHMLDHVLEATPSAVRLAEMLRKAKLVEQAWIPAPIWRLIAPGASRSYRWLVGGTLPPQLRERLDFPWSRSDALMFETFRRAVAATGPLLPAKARYLATAREAYAREGRLGLDAAFIRAERRQDALVG